MRARSPFLIFLFAVLIVAGPSLCAVQAAQDLQNEDSQSGDVTGEDGSSTTAAEDSSAATSEDETSDADQDGLNAIRRLEKKVDEIAGAAVTGFATVLFYEFVGRREYSESFDNSPLSNATLKAIIQTVDGDLTAGERKEAKWTVEFVRSELGSENMAAFDAALESVVETVRPLMSKAKAEVTLPEADFKFLVNKDDHSKAETAVITDALKTAFTDSPLRSFSIEEAAEGEKRSFTAANSGIPIIVAWLVVGAVFFTLRMGFINFRGFVHAIKVTAGRYDDPADEGEVSHFQALTAALSATVGLGNIAGVAIAVGVGGPGATFWMIIAGLLGMTSKFAECTLGQMYREVRPDGRIMGGAMFYLSRGLKELGLGPLGAVLGVLFAVMCVLASFGGGNAFQVNQAIGAVQAAFPDFQLLQGISGKLGLGIIMAVLVAIVIIGGIKRIASTAEKIVPLMCGVYVLACLFILVKNASAVPGAVSLIMDSAFTPAAGYGALIGVVVQGFRRAAFSNEAGVGSAAIAHSAAKTDYPVREGIVALLEPFIDTVVVCTMTALVIVITGSYDLSDPVNAGLITSNSGAALTSKAMGEEISWFPFVLATAVMLFAYSTMISWSYYGERCWAYLFGDGSSMVYKVIFVIFVVLGSVMSATNVLDLSDLMILGMAFPNILGVALLSGKVRRALTEYWQMLKAGDFDKP